MITLLKNHSSYKRPNIIYIIKLKKILYKYLCLYMDNTLMKLYFRNKKMRDFQAFAFKSYNNLIPELHSLLSNP